MRKKQSILMLVAVLGLIIITSAVTYAFFNYAKEGTTDNTITTGTITFLYTEVSEVGRGISIDDAFPISDTQGKAQIGEGKVFDFKVTSTTQMDASIPYEVTARKKTGSTLDESAVKLYLTTVDGSTETEVLLDNYDNLTQTSKVAKDTYTEKTIYTGRVPTNQANYEQNFRLRMWIDNEVDFSYDEEKGEYPYNDKSFTVTVNVYANAKVVTEEDLKAEITNLTVDGVEVTEVTGKDYNYEVTLPEGTTSTTINIETGSEYSTVEVEKLDSLAYSTNVKKLGVSKTLELTPGDNYFKITVTNEDSKIENQYILKIGVYNLMDSSYSLSVGDAVTTIDGSKWHVLEASASGIEMVVLLSDYNLNSDGSYNTSCGRDINSTYICSPMGFENDNSIPEIYYDESIPTNIGYFIKNIYESKVVDALPGTTNVTLPTGYQIATADGKTFTGNKDLVLESNTWLTTTYYWTSSSYESDPIFVFKVFYDDYVDGFSIYSTTSILTGESDSGARPVITTPKTNLLAE